MAGVRERQGQLVFGLDIGTRSIVGTVGYLNGGRFHVLAQRSKEHETRAMLDGQIHDIVKVGETIAEVKGKLEEDLNRSLTEVCIAAAGRVLRTVTTYVEHSFEAEKEITEEDIYSLSTMGVEKAYEEFQGSNDSDMKFYCVGYTPMRYYMNGYQIGNLEGHKAKNIAIDLIATFLPDDVVDGLYKAVELAGLKVANLTLEPIAAIQVAIPEKFRMLNMALVDVGAGTSDICITKEGTITAYGMIPVAGDSLTDILVQHCLVDFETAEQIKRGAGNQEVIEYQDIMGLPQTISAKEVLSLLESSVKEMTKMVADGIKELNGDKPVSAVFVVGGGGMIPGYTESLAAELGIVKERVAIRGQEVMQNITFELENARKDSMMVTPIGICLSYYEQSNNFIFVEFNGVRIKLYDNGKLSVADAAMQTQFPNDDLFPKRGKALTFNINGKNRIVRGYLGEAAVIKVNDAPADMYTQVHNGDKIEVTASTMGEEASMELGKLPELSEQLHIYVNGLKIDLPKTAAVNGSRENEFYQIKDGDDILIHNFYSVEEVAGFIDVPLGNKILVNDTPAKADTKVYETFTVSWSMEETEDDTDEGSADEEGANEGNINEEGANEGNINEEGVNEGNINEEGANEGNINEEGVGEGNTNEEGASEGNTNEEGANEGNTNKKGSKKGNTNKKSSSKGDANKKSVANENTAEGGTDHAAEEKLEPKQIIVIVNRQAITLSGKSGYVFVDVFDHINFDLKQSAGRAIVTTLNGRPAEYMEALNDGDIIEIYWKERLNK